MAMNVFILSSGLTENARLGLQPILFPMIEHIQIFPFILNCLNPAMAKFQISKHCTGSTVDDIPTTFGQL
jgi:hypothetical protein